MQREYSIYRSVCCLLWFNTTWLIDWFCVNVSLITISYFVATSFCWWRKPDCLKRTTELRQENWQSLWIGDGFERAWNLKVYLDYHHPLACHYINMMCGISGKAGPHELTVGLGYFYLLKVNILLFIFFVGLLFSFLYFFAIVLSTFLTVFLKTIFFVRKYRLMSRNKVINCKTAIKFVLYLT